MPANTRDKKPALLIFISYSTAGSKKLVLDLTKALKRRGITCWVDQEMTKGKNWREEILKAIQICDVFLPVMTKAFTSSEWTGQECGIAYAKGKLILPISFNNIRPGFVETLSAINVRANANAQAIVRRVVGALVDHGELRAKLTRQFVAAFCGKCDCDLATELSTHLLKLREGRNLKSENLKLLLKAYCHDRKRHEARKLASNLKELLQKDEHLHGRCLVLREFQRLTGFAYAR